MAWMMMNLRVNQLKASKNEHQYELLQLNALKRRMSSYSNALADGTVTPNEIAGLGTDLFGDALDCITYGDQAATYAAQEQTSYYSSTYQNITQEQYYNNAAVASKAALYFDENGNLDESKMFSEFYDNALKEYVEEYIMPYLKDKETEIEQQQQNLELLIQQEEEEINAIKQSISTEIQNSTIKLT